MWGVGEKRGDARGKTRKDRASGGWRRGLLILFAEPRLRGLLTAQMQSYLLAVVATRSPV